MKPENKRPITIEDLLRLKRTERPPAEFWSEFERQLRAKQLAALVEKRPWWQSFPALLSGLSRHRVPFGAAAAFALTILVVREYRSTSVLITRPADTVATQDIVLPVTQAVAVRPVEISLGAFLAPVTSSVPEIQHPSMAVVTGGVDTPIVPAQSATLSATIAVETQSSSPIVAATASSSLRSLSSREVSESAGFLTSLTVFETRPVVASVSRDVVDPLRHMTPPGESRRARFQTAMVSSSSSESPSRTSERAASRIAEERLYDQVSRFGARGDRLQVRF